MPTMGNIITMVAFGLCVFLNTGITGMCVYVVCVVCVCVCACVCV